MKRFSDCARVRRFINCGPHGDCRGQGRGDKDALPPGSVSRAEGLEAWKRIEAVVTHPRCANCHVDARAIPIWTPAGETKPRVHGMNIHGGESRIGAETIALLDLSYDLHPAERSRTGAAARRHRLAACPGGIHLVRQEWRRDLRATEGSQAQWRSRRRRSPRTFAARRIVERLHPSGVGARSRPHDAAGHLRGSCQRHGPVGSRRTTLSELTVLLLPSGRPARAEPNPSQSRLPS